MRTGLAFTLRRVTAAAAVMVVGSAGLASPAFARPIDEPLIRALAKQKAAAAAAQHGAAKPATPTAVAADPKPAFPKDALSSRRPKDYRIDLLAKAKPDECFLAVGVPYPAGPPCATGRPKVNQAYVWGLTQVGTSIWFGTGANTHCLTSGATLDYVKATANTNYTCEYGASQITKNDPAIPPEIGDQRPPEVWHYDKTTGASVNKSAEIRAKGPEDELRLKHTIGLRAAGNFGNVVLLGGPALENTLNMFAFDATTRQYLGSTSFANYGNIRTFLVAENALYLGVGIGRNGSASGAVLRWAGSTAAPFDFATVATLPVQAADLTVYDGRIAATSWPAEQPTTVEKLAGVWISPKFADGEPGLNPEDATKWTQVWHTRRYEPDRIVAATYGGGGIAAYDGYLYWGTMHVPMKSSTVHATVYPPKDDEAAKLQVKNTQRAISIWRAKDLGLPTAKIELVYGESQLPAWDPAANEGAGAWSVKPTNWTPLYGKSGFGYLFNNYTWRMVVADNKLFVGTMDWSYLVKDFLAQRPQDPAVNARAKKALSSEFNLPLVDPRAYGGDLWQFSSNTEPATAVTTTGMGNYLNYGIRNMLPNGTGLYLGMANPMNLRTSLTDLAPEGGWELIELIKK